MTGAPEEAISGPSSSTTQRTEWWLKEEEDRRSIRGMVVGAATRTSNLVLFVTWTNATLGSNERTCHLSQIFASHNSKAPDVRSHIGVATDLELRDASEADLGAPLHHVIPQQHAHLIELEIRMRCERK